MVRSISEKARVYIEDNGGNFHQIKINSGTLNTYRQDNKLEPAELSLNLPRGSPVQQNSKLIVAAQGKVLFRGAVKYKPDLDNTSKYIRAYCMTDYLIERLCPNGWYYPNGTLAFEDIFNDTIEDGILPGLLMFANSLVPSGQTFTTYSPTKYIDCLTGLGTSSYLGGRSFYLVHFREYIKPLHQCTSLSELGNVESDHTYAYYQDKQDLYIRQSYSSSLIGWKQNGIFLAENCRDTTVRLGDISNPSQSIYGDLVLNGDKIGDLLISLIAASVYYLHIRPDWSYVYLDMDQDIGRNPDDGVYTFDESSGDLHTIRRKSTALPKVDMLQGIGRGNSYYCYGNSLPAHHIRRESTYSVPNGFLDEDGKLKTNTKDEYNDRQTDYTYLIQPKRTDILCLPGDYIKLKPFMEQEELIYADTVKLDLMSNLWTLELANHIPNASDAWEYLQEVSAQYNSNYILLYSDSITETCTYYPSDVTHSSGTTGSMTFAVPDGVLDDDIKPRITLSMALTTKQKATDDAGRITVSLTIGGSVFQKGRFHGTVIGKTDSSGWTFPEMDCTDYINDDSDNTITITSSMENDAPDAHADYTGHPQISCSMTMNFWKRTR